jgi:hypothetical protein
MLIPNSVSDAIVEDIRKAAGAWTPDQLTALLRAGRRTRVADYDAIVRGLAQRYVGDQQQIVKGALTKAYPRTGDRMPVDPVNWLRFFARQDSGVYAVPPKRTLSAEDDGAPLPAEDPRVEAMGEALEQIGVDVIMGEAERRCATGARAAAVVVGYRRIGAEDEGKAVAHLYWPHDVVTIAHHSAPDDVEALWFVALKQATEHDKDASPLWWVWSREWTEDDAGNLVSFSTWTHRRVNESGTIATASETYEGRLPVAFLRTEAPAGGFWPEPDRDVSANVDHLNVARSNRQHVVNMQAHAQAVYSGTMRDASDLVGGPDAVIHVGSGEVLQYLTPSADHASIEASATRDLQELGVSRGNSPDAYAVEPGAPQSGVSRMIANAPHDQRVAEMRPIFEEFEEQHLLPIVIDVLERFSPSAPADFGDAYVEVVMGSAKTYEDDAAKTQRVLDLLAAKIVDEADARVMLGLSGSREEAQAYLAERQQAAPTVARLGGTIAGPSPFTQRETSPSSTPTNEE